MRAVPGESREAQTINFINDSATEEHTDETR